MDHYRKFLDHAESILRSNLESKRCLLLSLDITDFHLVNRFYGIEAGNCVLEDLREFLSGIPCIVLCEHIFSDKFFCLLATGNQMADEQILTSYQNYSREFLRHVHERYPSCHIKLACGMCIVEDAHLMDAVDGANIARKEAKIQGSVNPVLFDRSALDKIGDKYRLEQEMVSSLRKEQFCFFLQPKVDLKTGRIVGAEALARRKNADNKIIYPDTFLPIFEANGSVIELDFLICRQVCEFLSQRLKLGLPVIPISINLSRLHIQNPDTADKLHEMITHYGLPSNLLEMELTETIFLHEFKGAKNLIDRLRTYGYQVSIDDFGSGYAGINIWQELTFDVLKLDKVFLNDDPMYKARNDALVPNLINIGERLHTKVLCEGVETKEQCTHLMNLGCQIAQGFYFSAAVPPEEFFTVYESQNGCYPLPNTLGADQQDPSGTSGENPPKNSALARPRSVSPYFVILGLCAVFLAVCILAAFSFFRQNTQNEFSSMTEETLNAYVLNEKMEARDVLEKTCNTLSAFAVLISHQADPEFIDAYLQALTEDNPGSRFLYTTAQEFQERIADGSAREEDAQIIERLKKGETIVSDITFSSRMGNIYCFAVGVPVFQGDEFIGGLRAILNAETLVHSSSTIHEEILSSFLVDCTGKVIPVRADGTDQVDSLYTYLSGESTLNLSASGEKALKEALSSHTPVSESIFLGNSGDMPVYLSVTDLEYNDWHLAVILRAGNAVLHSSSIIHNTVITIAVLVGAVLFCCLVLFFLLRRLEHRVSAEDRRYLILEQFSDTVLFDYDCTTDTIHFTPNAQKLFCTPSLIHHGFRRNLSTKSIYAGDLEQITHAMEKPADKEQMDLRLRLLHPVKQQYFWCLVQYRYLFENGVPTSIVGKITDIDDQKHHEDYLIELSELDGLTGLYNKLTTQQKIGNLLVTGQPGFFFMIDVDNFKQINDQMGHNKGDQVLQFLASVLRSLFRSEDIIGRIGGDELVVFMACRPDPSVATKKARRFQEQLNNYFLENDLHLSTSIGISCCPRDGKTYGQLYESADAAMYHAKEKGKNCFCFYTKPLRSGKKL